MKTTLCLTLILLTFVTFAFVPNSFAQVIEIPDPFFKAQLYEALNKPDGSTITKQDMESLTELRIVPDFADWLEGRTTQDITGIEHAINLTELNIHRTRVSDITPLSGLTKLTWLQLASNDITDINPLAGLANLEYLHLADNNLSDITPLSGLTKLTTLFLSSNQIMDISPLTALTNLTSLSATHNQIMDISPLTALTNLTSLGLGSNPITDISPLTALTNLTSLGLGSNPITDISPLAALTNLTSLSVYDCGITDTDLNIITALINLTSLGLDSNPITDISPLTALTNLEYLSVYDNPIENIEPLLTLLQQNEGIEIYLMGPLGLSDPLTEENAHEYELPVIPPNVDPEVIVPVPASTGGDYEYSPCLLKSEVVQGLQLTEVLINIENPKFDHNTGNYVYDNCSILEYPLLIPQWFELLNTTDAPIDLEGGILRYTEYADNCLVGLTGEVKISEKFEIPAGQVGLIAMFQTPIQRPYILDAPVYAFTEEPNDIDLRHHWEFEVNGETIIKFVSPPSSTFVDESCSMPFVHPAPVHGGQKLFYAKRRGPYTASVITTPTPGYHVHPPEEVAAAPSAIHKRTMATSWAALKAKR